MGAKLLAAIFKMEARTVSREFKRYALAFLLQMLCLQHYVDSQRVRSFKQIVHSKETV